MAQVPLSFYRPFKRVFDVVGAIGLILVLALPCLVIALLVRSTSAGPVIHWSKRVGKNNELFLMPKFRTMRIDTPQLATHLLDGQNWLTPVGGFLRRSSMDEFPQLWSILTGHMSFVGPRPALFNQDDIVEMRTKAGIHTLRPGLTGWAQVNGRDDISNQRKVELDVEYYRKMCLRLDLEILLRTVFAAAGSRGVRH
jgi:O-antigen biosynthesis protein WbqP